MLLRLPCTQHRALKMGCIGKVKKPGFLHIFKPMSLIVAHSGFHYLQLPSPCISWGCGVQPCLSSAFCSHRNFYFFLKPLPEYWARGSVPSLVSMHILIICSAGSSSPQTAELCVLQFLSARYQQHAALLPRDHASLHVQEFIKKLSFLWDFCLAVKLVEISWLAVKPLRETTVRGGGQKGSSIL